MLRLKWAMLQYDRETIANLAFQSAIIKIRFHLNKLTRGPGLGGFNKGFFEPKKIKNKRAYFI